jgi:hypothetical protein
MTKDQIKKLAKVIVPALLALGAAYGYVDQSCTCSEPAPSAPVLEVPDAGK